MAVWPEYRVSVMWLTGDLDPKAPAVFETDSNFGSRNRRCRPRIWYRAQRGKAQILQRRGASRKRQLAMRTMRRPITLEEAEIRKARLRWISKGQSLNVDHGA